MVTEMGRLDARSGGEAAPVRCASCGAGAANEERQLLDLVHLDGHASELARSLAVGAVVRGRLTPEDAAHLSPYTAQELRAIASAGGAQPTAEPVTLSVVVPAYNEEENLDALWERVRPVLDAVGPSEIILVDDGSSDRTWTSITRLAASDPRVRGLRLSRNFGHQAALSAGMEAARGASVCFMDADLQDPPELVHELMSRWRAGYDVVYAVRASRKEGLVKRVAYRGFYRVYRRMANIDVAVDSGDFALLDRKVVERLLALPEHNRFLRGLRSWVGYRQIGVEYDRDERHAGAPKYTVTRLFRLAFDGILSFSAVPLRLASLLGVVVAAAGALYVAAAIAWRLVFGDIPQGWTSIIAIVLTVGGMQLVVVGVLGEYVARIYDETKGRPNYLVAETTAPPAPRP
jgi:dolichol-phosphate mannosyltransferase